MKLSEGELSQIGSYLESVKKADVMIELHRADKDDFMSNQYEYHKWRIFNEFLVLLIDCPLNLEGSRTFPIVLQLIKLHYPESLSYKPLPPKVQPLSDLLQSFSKSKAVPYSIPAPSVLVAAEESDSTMLDMKQDCDSELPDSALMEQGLKESIEAGLFILSPIEVKVISAYFGLNGYKVLSLEEIGKMYALPIKQVRQIKEEAIQRLRKSDNQNTLKSYS